MGEYSVYSSLQADSKVKFATWPTSQWPPGTDRLWPRGYCLLAPVLLNVCIVYVCAADSVLHTRQSKEDRDRLSTLFADPNRRYLYPNVLCLHQAPPSYTICDI